MVKTILFQGDSITDVGRSREHNLQPGDGLGTGYPMLVAARILKDHTEQEWNIVNRGISGHRIVDLYARWKSDTLNLRPDILSILIGVNDTWHEFLSNNGVDLPKYERFYREILQWTADVLPKTRIVMMEPYVLLFGTVAPEWIPEINERGMIVKKLAEEYGAIFIPLQKIFNDAAKKVPPTHWLGDGVHPRLAGHQLIADAWLEYAKDII